jgi:GDP-L-fucose synthase
MAIKPWIITNNMDKNAKVYVAGHRGLVGSALMRQLKAQGYKNIITRTHAELDLTDQQATRQFFDEVRPEFVFLAAAKVGGIHANDAYPADFIYLNLLIQSNVIGSAYETGVKRLLFLGSSCIYPRACPQPIKEEYLLTGPLESTNRSYALAKIAGIELCWSYNRQYGTQYLAVMPTNLYGPGDNFHPENSHVIPALIRRFHEAKASNANSVTIWGTGNPRREFLYSDDMADACIFLMNLSGDKFGTLLGSDESKTGVFMPPVVNIGCGEDLSIRDLAKTISDVVNFSGDIVFDTTRPDGTPRKLLDVTRLTNMGWQQKIDLLHGLESSYQDYKLNHAN